MNNLYVSSSFRKFLHDSDNKVAQFIMRGIYYQGWEYNAHRLMIRTDEVNYLTLRDDGTISYLPKGKEHKITDDGRWARDGRQNGTAGKIIKKILTPRAVKLFKDAEFMSFVNQYKAACDAECKEFIIRPNKEIPDVYCMTRERQQHVIIYYMTRERQEHVIIYYILYDKRERQQRVIIYYMTRERDNNMLLYII